MRPLSILGIGIPQDRQVSFFPSVTPKVHEISISILRNIVTDKFRRVIQRLPLTALWRLLGLCTSLDFIAFTSLTCVAMHAVLPSPPLRAQLSSKINSIFTGAWRSSSAVNARQSLCRRNASAKRRFEVEISKHLREHVDTRICLRIHIALSMS